MPLELLDADLPPVTGRPGLTQGTYGDRGNLELVVPAVDGGIWVCWFNADAVERRSGAAVARWSGGLHFGGAERVRAAAITQVPLGPDFLEVVAQSANRARRWVWTPQHGFVDGGRLREGATASSPITAGAADSDGALHALAVGADRQVAHLRGGVAAYPDLVWRANRIDGLAGDEVWLSPLDGALIATARDGEVLRCRRRVRGAWSEHLAPAGHWSHLGAATPDAVVGLDEEGRVQLAFRAGEGWRDPMTPWPRLRVDAVTAASTTLDGGRLDVVARIGSRLVHGWLPLDGPPAAEHTEPVEIRSTLWAEPGTPLHRRASPDGFSGSA